MDWVSEEAEMLSETGIISLELTPRSLDSTLGDNSTMTPNRSIDTDM